MVKTIAKETGIVILLIIAVILVIGILFYEYIPNNKTIPAKIKQYTLPQEVKTELQESVYQEQNIVKTYYIDSSDLSIYEASNDYDKGKSNPFADYTSNIEESTTTNTSNNNINSSKNNTNKSESYFNTSGK